jgi:hypothetical protein
MDDHFEWGIWNWIELYGDAGLLKNKTKAGNLYMTVK